LPFLHDIAFFKFTEYSGNLIIGSNNDQGHCALFTFNDKFVLGSHAGPLHLHKESGFESELLKEQLLYGLLGFFWGINGEANLRLTGGAALAWAHTCCCVALSLGELSEDSWEQDGTFLFETSSGGLLEVFLLFNLFTFVLGDLLALFDNFLGGIGDLLVGLLQFFLELLGDCDGGLLLSLNLFDFI